MIFLPSSLPASEYGYRFLNVTGAAKFTTSTLNVTDYPTASVAVSVQYANGTSAAGTTVSANIVSGSYYWWGANSSVMTSGVTNSSGVAALVLPTTPSVEVAAVVSAVVALACALALVRSRRSG